MTAAHHLTSSGRSACRAMISANATACPRCGAIFSRAIVVPVGLAIMLAIAVLYVLLQRYL
jgi:uncharacterized paraquat-inducible protein A